jgi:hypothetical protein
MIGMAKKVIKNASAALSKILSIQFNYWQSLWYKNLLHCKSIKYVLSKPNILSNTYNILLKTLLFVNKLPVKFISGDF